MSTLIRRSLTNIMCFNDHKEEDLAVGVREGVEEDYEQAQ